MPLNISRLTRFARQFGRFYARQFTPLLARTGLSMREVHVLLFLANNPGLDTARDITELRGLSKSQVSQAVETLADRDILRRAPDQSDRRVVHLSITEAGLPLAQEMQAIQAAFGRRLLEALPESEQTEFLRLLEKMLGDTEKMMEGESQL